MSLSLVKLTEPGGTSLWVNPDKVISLWKGGEGGTEISISPMSHPALVSEEPWQCIVRLERRTSAGLAEQRLESMLRSALGDKAFDKVLMDWRSS